MEPLRPLKIPLSSVPARPWHVEGAAIARILTHAEHGANFMVGVTWMEPGTESEWWSFEFEDTGEGERYMGPHHEMYFGIRGQFRLSWSEGAIEFGPDDTVFLAPGWRYRLANIGTVAGFFVYCVHPPFE